nr:hypothetical protein Iba_chr13fCG9710 [Ipomoea batatas]
MRAEDQLPLSLTLPPSSLAASTGRLSPSAAAERPLPTSNREGGPSSSSSASTHSPAKQRRRGAIPAIAYERRRGEPVLAAGSSAAQNLPLLYRRRRMPSCLPASPGRQQGKLVAKRSRWWWWRRRRQLLLLIRFPPVALSLSTPATSGRCDGNRNIPGEHDPPSPTARDPCGVGAVHHGSDGAELPFSLPCFSGDMRRRKKPPPHSASSAAALSPYRCPACRRRPEKREVAGELAGKWKC